MLDPEKYENNKSVAARDAAEFVPKIIDLMEWKNTHENVLDYGCGAGSTGYNLILPQIEKFDSNLYSVDISEPMLDFAKQKYSHPRITYAKGDIEKDFPFENVKFDKIFSIYVLHFISDIRNALKEFHHILKPGGYFGFTLVPKSYYRRSFKILAESEKWKEYMKGYQDHVLQWMEYEDEKGQEALSAILHEAGFEIVKLEVVQRSFKFDNMNTYLELYLSINPFLKTIPEDLHKLFKDDLRRLVTEFAGIPFDSEEIVSKYEFVLAVVQKPQ
ncbi:Juvenile hormone acid O-methyltransferase, partial [Orchesella cincta]